MKRLTLTLGSLCLLLSGAARAQTAPPVSVALEYGALEGCPDAASFQEQVLGRTRRVSFAPVGATAALTWSIRLAETNGGNRGTLRVLGEHPSKLERSVTAASCDQVVSALALVAALSVDPEASLSVRSAPPATSTPSSAPPEPPLAKRQPPEPPPKPPQPESDTSATKLALGLSLSGRTGLSPELAWSPRPFAGLSFRSRGGYTWGLRLSATQVHGHDTVDAGSADFTWNLARLEAIPLRASYGRWRFEPAVFVEGGEVSARGVGVSPVQTVRRPTLWAGALGRLSFLAFGLLLVELEGGPVVPLVRDRFYLFESTTVFRLPAVTGYLGAGVGLEFP